MGVRTVVSLRNDIEASLQEVLDRHGLPAIAAGRNSFWQFLFMSEEPVNQVDIMQSDLDRMKRLDLALLKNKVYVLPGVRRFVSTVHNDQDLEDAVRGLDEACRAFNKTG